VIGTELLRELIETVILTGKVKGIAPVSLLLIAAPESGKTSVVLERGCKSIEAYADITGRGIHTVIKSNPDLTHIVINDLVACLSHKQSVNRYTIAQLNAITEEGITHIATPGGIEKFEDGKRGIIASLTYSLVKDARHWWNKIGFTSRMLPFCYMYPADLIVQIKSDIDLHQQSGNNGSAPPPYKKPKDFIVPKNTIAVEYPASHVKEIRRIADVRAVILREQGMRRLKQYHALAQAHALWRKRNSPTVTEKDVEFIARIDKYVSYDEAQAL
jgi:hypothetical protein